MLREVSIPIALLAILASLLLPLPALLIDVLLVFNLLLALILLASSLYISEPLKLSALPSMLLLATLYRLALNVTTTRSILNSGQAGQVIEAFGQVVIQGNLVVGFVVFLIITIIQFLVIAKGAERVAEVAARFTLDALPGKQMSIDADVRAGLIDFETARQRRQDLQTESRFYGALDGAMKFIKGDAIAGIVIVVINCIGGMLVGTLVLDLDVVQALRQFTVLTIGDGLVTQVPALMNALAAGIIVTRVTRGDGQSLAYELPRQLNQLRSVKLIAAGGALCLASMPHMPAFPFVCSALLLLIAAATPGSENASSRAAEPVFQPRIPPLLLIRLGQKHAQELYAWGKLNQTFDLFRQRIFETTGLILNSPEFAADARLDGAFEIWMRGVPAAAGDFSGGCDQGIAQIVAALEQLLHSRSAECIDDILTRRMLDRFDKEAPELAAAVVPAVVSVTQLTELLRGLVAERLSVRNFDLILQAVAEQGSRVRNERALLAEARIALKRSISAKYARADSTLHAVVLSSVVDLSIAACEHDGKMPDPDLIEELLRELKNLKVSAAVLLTSKMSRLLMREILVAGGLDLPVLAFEEIAQDVAVVRVHSLGDTSSRRGELLEALAA